MNLLHKKHSFSTIAVFLTLLFTLVGLSAALARSGGTMAAWLAASFPWPGI